MHCFLKVLLYDLIPTEVTNFNRERGTLEILISPLCPGSGLGSLNARGWCKILRMEKIGPMFVEKNLDLIGLSEKKFGGEGRRILERLVEWSMGWGRGTKDDSIIEWSFMEMCAER